MPLTEPNTAPPFDVLRVSHVELGASDLAASRAFYEEALGMVVTAQDDDTLWLRGLEDTCHHAVVLRRGAPGTCRRLAFRVRSEADMDRALRYFKERGLEAIEVEERGQGRTLHVRDPFGVPLAFYQRQDLVERHLQSYDRYRGAAVQRLDHVNIFAAELQETYDWLAGDLGFRVSEYTETAEDPARLWAVWLHRKGNVHDIALTNGIGPRLHHVGLWVRGEMDVIHACDVLAASGMGAAIERGPGRHGISNAFFLYLRDPDGHRVELFTGDYRTLDPEFPPIRWDLDDPRRQTLWGHAAPKSWFDDGSPFEGVEPRQPRLPVRPVVAR